MSSQTQTQTQTPEEKIEFLLQDLEKIKESLNGIDFRQLEKAYQEAIKIENGWKMIYRCLYKECPVLVEETPHGKRVEFSPFETWNPTVVGFQQDATLQEMLEKLRKAIENDFSKYIAITAEKISSIGRSLKDTLEIVLNIKESLARVEDDVRSLAREIRRGDDC